MDAIDGLRVFPVYAPPRGRAAGVEGRVMGPGLPVAALTERPSGMQTQLLGRLSVEQSALLGRLRAGADFGDLLPSEQADRERALTVLRPGALVDARL